MNWYRINLSDGSIGFYELDHGGDTPLSQFMSQSPNAVVRVNRSIMLVPNGDPNKPGFVAVQPKQVNPLFACCDDKQEYVCVSKIISFGVIDSENQQWDRIYNNVFQESEIIKPNLKLIVPE